jgi:hypothetical protein
MKLYTVKEWWARLSFEEKFYKIIPWLKSMEKNVTSVHPSEVTDKELIQIYNYHEKENTL